MSADFGDWPRRSLLVHPALAHHACNAVPEASADIIVLDLEDGAGLRPPSPD